MRRFKEFLGKAKERLSRKVPRDQVPFFCVVAFLAALLASMVLGSLLSALCGWAVDGMGGGYTW